MDEVRNLRHLAAGQDGQFAAAQARSAGVTYDAVRALRRRGELIPVRRAVWRFAAVGGAPDPGVTAFLACWPEAVISHRTAALHHGLARVGIPAYPEITVPHPYRGRHDGIIVHSSRDLSEKDILAVGTLRYTTLARTLCDLATSRDAAWTLGLLDEAVALGGNRRWIHRRAIALTHGRDGVGLIAAATKPGASKEFRSWLERGAQALFEAAGLPPAQWNVRIYDRRGLIGIVDAYWPDRLVVVELEGLRFHTAPAARRRDAERFNRLSERGIRIRRFTWEDITQRPDAVVANIRNVLGLPNPVQ